MKSKSAFLPNVKFNFGEFSLYTYFFFWLSGEQKTDFGRLNLIKVRVDVIHLVVCVCVFWDSLHFS